MNTIKEMNVNAILYTIVSSSNAYPEMKYEEIIDLRRVSVTSQRHTLSLFMKAKVFECHLTALSLLYTLLTIDDQLCDSIWVTFSFWKGNNWLLL